jgi:hypothetical protein
MAYFFTELWHWLGSLERPFAFLLAIPFLIALAGLISLFFEKHHSWTGR